MSVAASSTRKTSKVWDYFEVEGNGNVFVNCVMSNWLTITLLELCVIIFNTGMYALAWRLAKAKYQSCHTGKPELQPFLYLNW